MHTFLAIPGNVCSEYQLKKQKTVLISCYLIFSPTFAPMIHVPEEPTQRYLKQIIIITSISYYYYYYHQHYYHYNYNYYYYYRIIYNVYKINKPRYIYVKSVTFNTAVYDITYISYL